MNHGEEPVPSAVTEQRQAEIDQAIENIRAMRQRQTEEATVEEILSSRHEGHRY